MLVFVIGDHMSAMYNGITYNVYERLLGMSQTPWSDRYLKLRLPRRKEERHRSAIEAAAAKWRIPSPHTRWPNTPATIRMRRTAF